MGLHDRLKTSNGDRSSADNAEALARRARRSAKRKTAAGEAGRPVRRAEEAASTTRASRTLGPELFKPRRREDLNERVMRAVMEQLVLDRTPLTREERRQIVRRDHRRHPRLRAARAVPSRRHRDGDHGQRVRPRSSSSARARSSATDAAFVDNAHLLRIIDKIVSQIGRRVDEASPMVDARLPDG